MLPIRRRALTRSLRQIGDSVRAQQTSSHQYDPNQRDISDGQESKRLGDNSTAKNQQYSVPLTGSAKLFADALIEEAPVASSSREHLRHSQGPIWTGEESQHDVVLRMLIDSHKPLRSGEGIKHNAADQKIHGWMKGMKLEPRIGSAVAPPPESSPPIEASHSSHRTTIPPHLHRPWHSTYTGSGKAADTPQIKYGTFHRKRKGGDDLTNLLELQLPPDANGTLKSRLREIKRAGRVVRRFEEAREGATDYRLGLTRTDGAPTGDDETFRGNRQIRGASVLGAQRGASSGLRAWAGLVEERIQVNSLDLWSMTDNNIARKLAMPDS
jgi:aarF domain-containing kinase